MSLGVTVQVINSLLSGLVTVTGVGDDCLAEELDDWHRSKAKIFGIPL